MADWIERRMAADEKRAFRLRFVSQNYGGRARDFANGGYLSRLQKSLQNVVNVAQTSQSAVSRISKSAVFGRFQQPPTKKSAIQQVWKPALQCFAEDYYWV
jgi:hypothetical protein